MRSDNLLRRPEWNAYAVGAGIGVLSWLVFWLVDKPLGMSTSIAKISGAAVKVSVGAERFAGYEYWQKYTPAWDYGMVFLVATLVGAMVSALASRSFRIETVPVVWRNRFGGKRWPRMAGAFCGGAVLLLGARLAGGCTSGHGISGTLQLAASGWVFFAAMFVSGVITARVVYGKS